MQADDPPSHRRVASPAMQRRRVRKLVRGFRGVGLARFGALVVVEGGLFALVVRVSRCPESVRAGLPAGTAPPLEGAGDPRPPARADNPPPAGLAAEAD